jgi:large subunit ribosomal protein L15
MSLSMNTMRSAKGTRKSSKRIGRGQSSGRGKTAGRGTKGQSARSGGKKKLKLKGMKQMLLTFPKSRGFQSEAPQQATVRVSALEVFGAGSVVTLTSMRQKGLIKRSDRGAKIVGGGELTKKLTFEGVTFSTSAKAAIEKAGGEIRVVKAPRRKPKNADAKTKSAKAKS